MGEIIYVLTVIFTAYVVYTAEGDNIVAFINDVFHIDLSHPHECCTNAINRVKNTFNSFNFKPLIPV